jgi:hypothetical protein
MQFTQIIKNIIVFMAAGTMMMKKKTILRGIRVKVMKLGMVKSENERRREVT